ncbi:hypothetical protein AYI69_g10361 [Smittium culicis]|uniref:Uncharacterized protein n=1 Tax=Smittium culicis TaxID=133412 RepID=A0A1R1X686_9FUNG|nr:hypothetical protein AYI69_g10361 [Smittium culicis]
MDLNRRMSQLEVQFYPVPGNSEVDIYVDSYNYIVEKLPSMDLLMYPELAEALPGSSKYFFKIPITDMEKIKFLGNFPRNSEMVYYPLSLNEIGLSREFKKEIQNSMIYSK